MAAARQRNARRTAAALGPAGAHGDGDLLVLALTTAAGWLGPQLSGLLSTFPLFAGVLTVFAHHAQGKAAAINVLRGLLLGLFSFAAFFVALGATIERVGIAPAFAAALAAALAVQTLSLLLARRTLRRL